MSIFDGKPWLDEAIEKQRQRQMEAALHKALGSVASYDPVRDLDYRRNLLSSAAVGMAEKTRRTATEVEAMRREAFLRTADRYADYRLGTGLMGAGPTVATTTTVTTVSTGEHTHTLPAYTYSYPSAKYVTASKPGKAVFMNPMSNGAIPEVGMRVKHDGATFIIDRIEIDTSGPTWTAVAVGHAVGESGVFTAGRLLMRAPTDELEPAEPEIKESAA